MKNVSVMVDNNPDHNQWPKLGGKTQKEILGKPSFADKLKGKVVEGDSLDEMEDDSGVYGET